ncbi:FtsB family cell division protein [Mycolicibacterium komossense]|uniref:Septum formation initiator family protein n=1 Tax=Mycolicibacterium komossense TaxID=1779 RepID=A0ABT3CEB6_9MYCO|nr:septum formation initiator family protein [Mycolicibacterium komossense]MCV7227826.1 septum formation initiator family protein [Mycolicibacterium komossense]
MSDAKRERRSPTSRPGRAGEAKGRPRKTVKPSATSAREPRREAPAEEEVVDEVVEPSESVLQSISAAIAEQAEQQSEQRLGFTARRAAILAAVVCVLTLTIAGPVRTYFAQRTEMKQLAATEQSLRSQIADLEQQKQKLADPVFIAAQARERLGFVMPGDIPYQVQLPPSAALPPTPGEQPIAPASTDPWYTALWKTIADAPHGAAPVEGTAPPELPVDPPPPPPGGPGG